MEYGLVYSKGSAALRDSVLPFLSIGFKFVRDMLGMLTNRFMLNIIVSTFGIPRNCLCVGLSSIPNILCKPRSSSAR